jgi:hypothetical protein
VRFLPTGRTAALALVTGAVIVPLGVFGAPALARTASAVSQYGHSSSSQYQYKVAICHRTHSKKHPWHVITVGAPAVKAHLKHGDTLAPCPTTAPTAPTKHHGKGNGKGEDNDSQNSSSSQGSDDGPGHSNGHGKGHNK